MKTILVSKNFLSPKNDYQRKVYKLYNLLVENFPQTFFVGGSVRNTLWNKFVYDFDIATVAKPNEVIKLLSSSGNKVDHSAAKLGVVTVAIKTKAVQIATFRTEVYTTSRFPKISFTKSLLKDAKRRDFTINSLYFNSKTHELTDPLNSLADIDRKILRSIGNPEKKFREDPLRIIRAWRFAKTYHLTVEPKTLVALTNLFELTNQLSDTKIKNEVALCASQNVKKFLLKKFV